MSDALPGDPMYHHYGLAHEISHMILSGVIHGLIYAFIFKLFHHFGLAMAFLVVVLGLGGLWFWARSRDRRTF